MKPTVLANKFQSFSTYTIRLQLTTQHEHPAFGQLHRSFNARSYEPHHDETIIATPWPTFVPKLSISIVCGLLMAAFLVLNLKNLPGIWHMWILNAFRFILRTQRPPVMPSSSHIFQPLITSSSAQLLEIDFNIHKSNSSYFSDLDISCTLLVCTLFAQGIESMRWGGTEAYTGSKTPQFGFALGAVSCNFRKEVLPYQQYEMWSKILAWDKKWIYIITHFVRKDWRKPRTFSLYPHSNGPDPLTSKLSGDNSTEVDQDEATAGHFHAEQGIFATALNISVFKFGRKTLSLDTMLELSSLLPLKAKNDERERIEAQRLSGLRVASNSAAQKQRELEAEFRNADGTVLARHTDATDILGVMSMLMQLAT